MFPVHRAILSAVSPFFKALFINNLKGGKSETTEVAISSVSGEIFSLILDYAYTGTCNVSADNVERLLPLADQFEVLGIVQLCCQFLLQELRPDNCLGEPFVRITGHRSNRHKEFSRCVSCDKLHVSILNATLKLALNSPQLLIRRNNRVRELNSSSSESSSFTTLTLGSRVDLFKIDSLSLCRVSLGYNSHLVARVHVTAGIFKFACHYFCRDLERQGRKYIRHHFKQILQESGEFKDLLCDELMAILSDDELNVKNEEIVFDAVKTWVESGAEERRVYLPRLLECIRYGLMTHKYFVNNIVSWKLVEGDEVSTHLRHC